MVTLESIEDEMRGVVTYELRDGSRVRLPARAVAEFGAATILRDMGCDALLPTDRVAVMRRGKKIGTVPPDFDPAFIKSKNYFYDPRPGDFKREGDVWVAANNLGPGDFEAIPGFIRDRS